MLKHKKTALLYIQKRHWYYFGAKTIIRMQIFSFKFFNLLLPISGLLLLPSDWPASHVKKKLFLLIGIIKHAMIGINLVHIQNVPSQNVPLSKRPFTKQPITKCPTHQRFHSSYCNVPLSKRPITKCPTSLNVPHH